MATTARSERSSEAGRRPGPLLYVVEIALFAIVYWGAARLSLQLALVRGQVTPIWPPTGIALVMLLLLGDRMWPAITIGALAVNLPLGPSPEAAALISAGNTLAPLASARLLRLEKFRPQIDRFRDAVALVILGALVGMTISATIGSAVLTLSGSVPMANFAPTWAVWWAGDAMGVLIVAPVLLSFVPRPGIRPLGWARAIELALLLCGVGIVTFLLFSNTYHLEYLVLPVIAVAAWRFRLAGAAPAALIASLIAVWAAVNGTGPFRSESLFEKMLTLQAFNVSVSLASFVLAAFADARQRTDDIARLYFSASHALAAKNDAIAVAAAELGPPVALLTSYLAVLSDGNLGPPPQRWTAILNVMADKAWQVSRIINELTESARIEAKSEHSNRAYLDLREAVQQAAKRAVGRADNAGARISAKLGTEAIPVDADPRQIGRILDNLIHNSLTYVTRPPRVQLQAAVEGEHAVVRVVDNGVGLTETERGRIFQPFYRTSNPAFTGVPGLGLGLFASQKLAEANRGSLALERTEHGVGTSFLLELPLAQNHPARPKPMASNGIAG